MSSKPLGNVWTCDLCGAESTQREWGLSPEDWSPVLGKYQLHYKATSDHEVYRTGSPDVCQDCNTALLEAIAARKGLR